MNNVQLIGRLVKDPEVRYTQGQNPMAVATFTLAINRPTKDGVADYPRVTVFGKQAEICEKYLAKGSKVAVDGTLQTGSYENKHGDKVYTTDVVARRVEFLESRSKTDSTERNSEPLAELPPQFEQLQSDVPF